MTTCWCYVFFTPAPRVSEGGRGRGGKPGVIRVTRAETSMEVLHGYTHRQGLLLTMERLYYTGMLIMEYSVTNCLPITTEGIH